ncbi:MAG: cyclase family protein [Bacteroidales bacterium]|nr:cyclase family protein [Bacteroidales bacterium]
MKLSDLTHTLETGMPVFPGDTAPTFKKVLTHKSDGVQVTRMDMATHHGTHIDCPLHFIENGKATDNSDLKNFFGKAILLDCTNFRNGEEIPVGHIQKTEINWEGISWVIIHTGWYKLWGTPEYLHHFPVLSVEATKFLKSKNLKGIGLDVISLDAIDSVDFPNHNIILGSGLYIIENLTNLHSISKQQFTLSALPLKIKNGDGSPVRALAIEDAL